MNRKSGKHSQERVHLDELAFAHIKGAELKFHTRVPNIRAICLVFEIPKSVNYTRL